MLAIARVDDRGRGGRAEMSLGMGKGSVGDIMVNDRMMDRFCWTKAPFAC